MIIPPHGIAVYKIEAENCGAEHNLCAETAINFEGLQDTAFLTDAQAEQSLIYLGYEKVYDWKVEI